MYTINNLNYRDPSIFVKKILRIYKYGWWFRGPIVLCY